MVRVRSRWTGLDWARAVRRLDLIPAASAWRGDPDTLATLATLATLPNLCRRGSTFIRGSEPLFCVAALWRRKDSGQDQR